MDPALLIKKAFRSLRRNGFRATLSIAARSLVPRRDSDDFDRKYGTDTARSVPLWKLRIQSPNSAYGTNYQTTSEENIAATISRLGPYRWQSFTFIDLGCGKGRTLIVAHRLGFGRLIGVEFSEDLAQIARRNLAKLAISNATVEQCDAATFVFPGGDMLIYLFNPFSDEVMQSVVERLHDAVVRAPGEVLVVYDFPRCPGAFDRSGFLVRSPGTETQFVWRFHPGENRARSAASGS